ncbi:MAG: tRNA pseudouridine(38-40) synthase TruA [Bacilli bacterium]|nr:tRNA pseudouridine(38-40) synthase TruA [Bacilli bacterium]MDD4076424.1 tRNA pseudouridine(38-40) synthase TruA [Bacilli bacterium]MDD4387776.1 tRNA pseudouridine(38-40) synthase TruA [Bacilli bacterium]
MRYKCTCSYDGTLFHGFQTQKKLRTVQSEIEKALLLILNYKTKIYPSGRTDAGVHALGQVFHFDSNLDIKKNNMKNAINSRLPQDIYISDTEVVDKNFHARFSAKSKEYHYFLDFGLYNPLFRHYRYYCRFRNVDYIIFEEALRLFCGQHDFRYFSRSKNMDNTIREIHHISCEKTDKLLKVIITGNGFLHNMVRIIIATALEAARGKITLWDIKVSLSGKTPLKAPKKLPPNGLYLMKINY